LDGARLFNALIAGRQSPRRYGELFDTISICLSKGLGTPSGSLLLGSKVHIAKAHRYRKVMGGGMRQAGYLAAAGIYALDHHVERLREDHLRAKALANELGQASYVQSVLPVETNIVIFELGKDVAPDAFLSYLQQQGVRAMSMGAQLIRCVFHLDISDRQLDSVTRVVRNYH
jgi:threonine aldolase